MIMAVSKEKQNGILALMRECGDIILSAHAVEAQSGAITVKPGEANFVTVYDVRVQEILIGGLRALFPDAYFYAEEKDNSAAAPAEGLCFFIDPIDGTTNFIHNMQCSAVSVGLYENGVPVFGAVYDPYRGEMYHAAQGEGAYLNGEPISVSSRPLEKALISVGTAPYNRVHADETFQRMRRVFLRCADLRRCGSAALDVCWVACGRTDAYFEDVLSPWDYAAGALILKEAGGEVTTYAGQPHKPGEKASILCSNKVLHQTVLDLINE